MPEEGGLGVLAPRSAEITVHQQLAEKGRNDKSLGFFCLADSSDSREESFRPFLKGVEAGQKKEEGNRRESERNHPAAAEQFLGYPLVRSRSSHTARVLLKTEGSAAGGTQWWTFRCID